MTGRTESVLWHTAFDHKAVGYGWCWWVTVDERIVQAGVEPDQMGAEMKGAATGRGWIMALKETPR